MGLVIKSTSSTDELKVDATSNAARVTSYKTDGTSVYAPYIGAYCTKLEIIPTTLASGTTYFSMRNLGAKSVHIQRILMNTSFIGVAAGTRSIFEISRFSTATPSTGTTQAVIKKNNNYPTSNVTDIRFNAGGLTTTNVVFEAPLTLIGVTSQLSYQVTLDFQYPEEADKRFVLASGEGLCIRANTAIVSGAAILGQIDWDEL